MKGELWHKGLLLNYVDIQGEGVHRLFVQTRVGGDSLEGVHVVY